MAREKLTIARVFIAPTPFVSSQIQTTITNKTIPTTGWKQIYTKGAIEISRKRETVKLENDQQGLVDEVITKDTYEIKLPLSASDFETLLNIIKLDPEAGSSDTVLKIRSNSGKSLTDTAFTLLIYDKASDPSNETDEPNPDNCDESWVFWKCVISSDVTVKFSGEQRILELTITPLIDTTSGTYGIVGTITKQT